MRFLNRIIEPKQHLADDRKIFTNSMLKAMIIPLLIEQLLQMVVGLADTMMVSHAGEAVVAGVGLDTMIYTIFIYLFTAISAGGSVVVAQYIGSIKAMTTLRTSCALSLGITSTASSLTTTTTSFIPTTPTAILELLL